MKLVLGLALVIFSGYPFKQINKKDKSRETLRAEREILEGGRGNLKTGGGSANIVEAILKKINLKIRLFFESLKLFYAHLLHCRSHSLSSPIAG